VSLEVNPAGEVMAVQVDPPSADAASSSRGGAGARRLTLAAPAPWSAWAVAEQQFGPGKRGFVGAAVCCCWPSMDCGYVICQRSYGSCFRFGCCGGSLLVYDAFVLANAPAPWSAWVWQSSSLHLVSSGEKRGIGCAVVCCSVLRRSVLFVVGLSWFEKGFS
jgi:hypothetical protein